MLTVLPKNEVSRKRRMEKKAWLTRDFLHDKKTKKTGNKYEGRRRAVTGLVLFLKYKECMRTGLLLQHSIRCIRRIRWNAPDMTQNARRNCSARSQSAVVVQEQDEWLLNKNTRHRVSSCLLFSKASHLPSSSSSSLLPSCRSLTTNQVIICECHANNSSHGLSPLITLGICVDECLERCNFRDRLDFGNCMSSWIGNHLLIVNDTFRRRPSWWINEYCWYHSLQADILENSISWLLIILLCVILSSWADCYSRSEEDIRMVIILSPSMMMMLILWWWHEGCTCRSLFEGNLHLSSSHHSFWAIQDKEQEKNEQEVVKTLTCESWLSLTVFNEALASLLQTCREHLPRNTLRRNSRRLIFVISI